MDQAAPQKTSNHSAQDDFDLDPPQSLEEEQPSALPSPQFPSCYVTQRMNVNVFMEQEAKATVMPQAL